MIRISALEIHSLAKVSFPQEVLFDPLLYSLTEAYSFFLLALSLKFISVIIWLMSLSLTPLAIP